MEYRKRKPVRLAGYNYSGNGTYFITICTNEKRKYLWNDLTNTDMTDNQLSDYGVIVRNAIMNIPVYYLSVTLNNYIVMPNHVHILITIRNDDDLSSHSVSNIISQMKRAVTKEIGFSIWQKSFHDHIVRSEKEFVLISKYISENPDNWIKDCFYEA